MIIIMIIMTTIREMMIMAMIMMTIIAVTMEQIGLEVTTWICILFSASCCASRIKSVLSMHYSRHGTHKALKLKLKFRL
jgi:hypothetical protein